MTTSAPPALPEPPSSPRARASTLLAGARGLRRWLPAAVLVLAAAVTGWAVHRLDTAGSAPVPERREDPDYYLDNFTTTTTNELGVLERRLSAEHMLHFPDTDTNELTKPHLVLYHAEHTPWHIESERGWVSASGEVVLLLGRVHAWRDDDAGVRLIDIRTRDLRILPNSDYGETDRPVVIRSRGSETRGVGMRAYLRESRVELLSQVTTTYRRKDVRN